MSATYTFRVCDAAGVPVGFAAQFSGASSSFEMSDAGSISFNYLKTGVNYALLDAAGPVEIALLQNGIEMKDGRYRIRSKEDDELDNLLTKFTGVSLVDMLKGAIVYSGDGSLTLGVDQVFTGTAGAILKALFDQNAARGTNRVMDRITYASFGNTLDSNGVAWAFTLTDITYTVGVNYLDVLRNMVNNGMIEFEMVGRDLRVYNAGTMGADKTIISEPIVLRKGRDLTEAPRTRTNEQIAAVGLIQGDGGILKQLIDTSVGAAWGYDEVFISQGGISDDTTLGILTAQELERRSQVRVQNTHKVALNNSPWTPGLDYSTSDYIYTDRGNGPEKLRVRQMVLDIDPGGVTYASIVLNDKFLEREIAIARRVDGILGGASAGGSVAIPTGPDPGVDTTIPNAPASLSSISSVYVNEAGRSLAAVALSWPAVTQNTDTSTITDLDHYETEYKIDAATSIVAPSVFGPARDEDYYTHQFDRRWKSYGWIAGDQAASVRATSGMDFWLMGSSVVGTAFGSGKTNDGVVIHNAAVLTDTTNPELFTSLYGMPNKLGKEDAWVDTTVGNWQADTNCAVARDTSTFYYGTANMRITATAAADAIARIAAPPTTNFAVTVGKTYTAMAKVKTLSGTARNVQIGIRWYTAANALISTSLSTSTASNTTTYTRYNSVAVAPATAAKATMTIVIKAAAAAQVFNCDTMGIYEGDMSSASWSDPLRAATGPLALIHPEDLGGAAIASGSLAAACYRMDTVFMVSGKIYGVLTRVNAAGAFQSQTAIARWDGTTHAFESVTTFTNADIVSWGNAHYISGGFIYLYGYDTGDAASAKDILLMRVPDSNITGGTKEYISNAGTGTWTTTRASAVSIHTGVNYHFGNITFSGGLYNLLIIPSTGIVMQRLTATNLYGSFTNVGTVYSIPNIGGALIAYAPRIHGQLSDNYGYMYGYSVGGNGYAADIKQYAPKFARGPMSPQLALVPLTGWSAPRQIESGVLTDNIGDIVPGWNFQARVRAVDSNGHYSAWRDGTAIRVVDDTTPPNKPSAPIVSPYFKGIRVEWDGQDYQGGPAPGDWDRMEVHISTIDNFIPGTLTLYDTFITRLGGVSPIQDLVYGQIYYVRFVAIDVRNNRSDPSDVSSTSPEQLVNAAEIGKKLIQGANIADGTIATNQLTVAAFEPSIILNGSFEDEATNADGTGTGLPYGWSPAWAIGAGSTASYDTTTPIAGSKSLQLVQATAADGHRWQSVVFPVTAGKLLAASVKVRANRAIANPAFEMHIVVATTEAGTGSTPSGTSVWGTSVTALGTTTVQTLELQRIVDANMKFARVFVAALNSADGSGWTATIDNVEVRPVGGSAFIADASILNAKIANLAVDDAKIASASIGKLTAGTLLADMTVSARIKTANTGARVELNSAGLQAFNSSSVQTVDIAAASGNATITGLFRTDFPTSTTPHLEMINSGDRTTIYFMGNTGAGTQYAYINSPADVANIPTMGINSGTFSYLGITSRHRLWLNNNDGIVLETFNIATQGQVGFGMSLDDFQMEIRRVSSAPNITGGVLKMTDTTWELRRYGGGVLNGGQIFANTSQLFLEATATGVTNGQIVLADSGQINIKGRFDEDDSNGGDGALFCGTFNSAAAATYSVSYGTTMATRPQVLYSIHAGSAQGDDRLTVFDTLGFTVDTVTSVAINLNYWAFRTI